MLSFGLTHKNTCLDDYTPKNTPPGPRGHNFSPRNAVSAKYSYDLFIDISLTLYPNRPSPTPSTFVQLNMKICI